MKPEIQLPPPNSSPFARDKSDQEINVGLAIHAESAAEKTVTQLKDLHTRMTEAQFALNEAAHSFRKHTLDWVTTELPESIKQLRATRMTITAEFSQMLKPLEDLRKFFHGINHETEINRLREFTELCERLKALKDSGFLDTVAETMLRLAP